jgi:serine/threonine protein kinase
MAVVYKATHRNQAEFAIKMLHPELSLNEDMRTRFLREGYAANSVKHPGSVCVVDDDVAEDGAAFLVMELLDGMPCDSLATACGGCLSLDAACAIALETLEVLVAAHSNGIIHRDIKPANLFLMRDGGLKVLDFGIARVRDSMASGVHSTGTGMLLGTPAFMAPEQAVGKAGDLDARADLWAVGATVFGLASGQMVHDAETAAALFVKLATEQARSLSVALPGAPGAVAAVVDRALSLDKTQRWPTAMDMHQALAWARHTSLSTAPPRTVIASLVAAHARPSGRGGEWTAPALPVSPVFSPPAQTPWRAQLTPPAYAPDAASTAPPVVETGGAVSSTRHPHVGQRSGNRLVVALAGTGALAASVGLAFVLHRAWHAPVEPAVAAPGVGSIVGSASAYSAPIPAPSALPSSDPRAAPAASVAPPDAPAPAASRKDPPRAISVPWRAAMPKPPVAAPQPSRPTPSGPSTPPTPPAGADPLDGRR